jgi:hypothetical protein
LAEEKTPLAQENYRALKRLRQLSVEQDMKTSGVEQEESLSALTIGV